MVSEASYYGTEFILGFGESIASDTPRDLELYITTSADTTVTITVYTQLTSPSSQQVTI